MITGWIQFSYCFENSHLHVNEASGTKKFREAFINGLVHGKKSPARKLSYYIGNFPKIAVMLSSGTA